MFATLSQSDAYADDAPWLFVFEDTSITHQKTNDIKSKDPPFVSRHFVLAALLAHCFAILVCRLLPINDQLQALRSQETFTVCKIYKMKYNTHEAT